MNTLDENGWMPIETAPRDGREILGYFEGFVRVCYPKRFPRRIVLNDDMSQSMRGDTWEYFRDETYAPGHSWSMTPTHWQPLPLPPISEPVGKAAA